MSESLDLAAVISQVESGGDPHRLRFESALYVQWGTMTQARSAILATIAQIHDCSHDTARMIACTSWGKYQILGENLYDTACGCKLDVFAFADDEFTQDACFDSFLVKRGIAYTLDDILTDADKRKRFIKAYNGPGAVDAYWNEVRVAIKALGGTPPTD